MQTFLPYPNFSTSAAVLDMRRLGKQRVEVLQILGSHINVLSGWRSHPASIMWRGHGHALVEYGIAICDEWIKRGYKDTVRDQLFEIGRVHGDRIGSTKYPWWLGEEAVHSSHRSNLLRKDPVHYGVNGWTEPPNLPYVWPGLGR